MFTRGYSACTMMQTFLEKNVWLILSIFSMFNFVVNVWKSCRFNIASEIPHHEISTKTMAFEASFLGGSWSSRKLMRSLKFIALLKKSAKIELNQQDILVSDYLVDERLFFR